jgi:integrase
MSKPKMTLREAFRLAEREHYRHLKDHKGFVGNAGELEKVYGADTQLSALTTTRIREGVSKMLEAGNSHGTVNRKLVHLSKTLKMAVEDWEVLDAMPRIKKLREPARRIDVPSLGDVERIIQVLPNEAAALAFILHRTGAREGEVLRVQRKDLDMRQQTVTFWETKGGRSRTLPLDGDTFDCLFNWAGNWTLNKSTMWRHWANACKKLGIPHVKVHALRHGFATRLLEATGDIKLVQEWLGHSSVTTTEIYAHLVPSRLRKGFEVLQLAFPQGLSVGANSVSSGLENRQRATVRGFESHLFRQSEQDVTDDSSTTENDT